MAASVEEFRERLRVERKAANREFDGIFWRTLAYMLALILGTSALTTGAIHLLADLRQPTATALCSDAMARLMRAETVVELEREKFLIGSLRCDVERRLTELRPAGEAR